VQERTLYFGIESIWYVWHASSCITSQVFMNCLGVPVCCHSIHLNELHQDTPKGPNAKHIPVFAALSLAIADGARFLRRTYLEPSLEMTQPVVPFTALR